MKESRDIASIVRHFQMPGEFLSAALYGNGHIHESWCAILNRSGASVRYLLQRINTRIFTRPVELMQNIERVTRHIASAPCRGPGHERSVLHLIATHDGKTLHIDDEGACWRAYDFVEGTRALDIVETTDQAFQAARAYGRFQYLLTTLGPPRLNETIPGFHDTPHRFAAFERALEADAVNRAALARPEIEFALAHKGIAATLLDAGLPERITHNDTKLNNVLLDEVTGEAVCVIDLDTVMPGLALYDFGDMMRTATSPAPEDERNLSRVEMRFPYFEALLRGYLSTAGEFLTAGELDLLAFSGRLITFEIGIRFLTDFLSGDTYFRVHREGHNLDRCRTQFRLAESMEQQEDAMNRLVRSLAP